MGQRSATEGDIREAIIAAHDAKALLDQTGGVEEGEALVHVVYAEALAHAGDPEAVPNTFVTGVVIGSEDDVLIEIYLGHHCIARTKATCGLFKIDLAGKVAQDELFTVRIRRQVGLSDSQFRPVCYLPVRYLTNLGDSQNMELEVRCRYRPYQMWRRRIPDTRRIPQIQRRSYINDI